MTFGLSPHLNIEPNGLQHHSRGSHYDVSILRRKFAVVKLIDGTEHRSDRSTQPIGFQFGAQNLSRSLYITEPPPPFLCCLRCQFDDLGHNAERRIMPHGRRCNLRLRHGATCWLGIIWPDFAGRVETGPSLLVARCRLCAVSGHTTTAAGAAQFDTSRSESAHRKVPIADA